MTYKKLAIELIRREADKWLEEVLKENGVCYHWVHTSDPTIEDCKEKDMFYWDCRANVVLSDSPKYETVRVIIGGTADDLVGVCSSVLWNEDKKILWMSVAKTREQLGIEKLDLKGEGR